jgi:hypothetical protein
VTNISANRATARVAQGKLESDGLRMRRDGSTDYKMVCKLIENDTRHRSWPAKFHCSERGLGTWTAEYGVSLDVTHDHLILTPGEMK